MSPVEISIVGADGSVDVSSESTSATVEVQSEVGAPGPQGSIGQKGWAPILAVVTDSERRVHRIVDWTGGEGTEPATGSYIGPAGLVATAAEATDIRGATGPQTTDASLLTSGVLDDDRVAESNVTQHEAALSIAASQVTGTLEQSQQHAQTAYLDAATAAFANAVTVGGAFTVGGSSQLGDSAADRVDFFGPGTFRMMSERTTGVSTTAVAILTVDNVNSGSASMVLVSGSDGAGNEFLDVVMFPFAGTPAKMSTSAERGSPATRTYSRTTNYQLKLAMGSGTYAVNCTAMMSRVS